MSIQSNWWWCNKCETLTFGGGLTPGNCPKSGQHDHIGSNNYSLVQNDPAAPGQANWRWCNKCQSLTFAGNPGLGACATGGVHDHAGSGNYVLVQNNPAAPGQHEWRHCTKCEALIFGGNPPAICPKGGNHDHTGSGNYVVQFEDGREPIDQPIRRHLLTEFGSCNSAPEAYKTLETACLAMVAKGGGILVIPAAVSPDFVPRNSVQDVAARAGVLIEDYRDGAFRLVVPPESFPDIYSDVAGGMIVERDMVGDITGQGGGAALAVANRSRGGVNSVNDVMLKDAPAGANTKFYVTSLRGLCPGNYLNVANNAGKSELIRIKALDMDASGFYFTTVDPTQYSYATGDRFWHKNWFSALEISDTHNCDDQSGTVSIERTTYGSGDSFGVNVTYGYASDIMSAGGDEGTVLYSAEVRHDVDLFWGEVESWDANTQTLVYTDQTAPTQKPENWWKIGTSRPVINMNSGKWINAKIVIPQNGYKFNGSDSAVLEIGGNPDPATIIGKFITIDETSEYYKPGESLSGGSVVPGNHIIRRWFRISDLSPLAAGQWKLGIETVWWGSHTGGKPALLNWQNYYTTSPNELKCIIAPGSWVIDVRTALGPREYYLGTTPAERTLRLAPFADAANAFAPGDPIAQPAGPTPWMPTSYRTRHVNLFPNLVGGAGVGFQAINLGSTAMGSGLHVAGPAPDPPITSSQELIKLLEQRKDNLPVFAAGVSVESSTTYGIAIGGPSQFSAIAITGFSGNSAISIGGASSYYGIEVTGATGSAAILLAGPAPSGIAITGKVDRAIQFGQWGDTNAKPVLWYGKNFWASIGLDLDSTNGDFKIDGGNNSGPPGNINLSSKSTLNQSGLSATSSAAKNLRGINVSIPANHVIAFPQSEPDTAYAVLVQCSWQTETAVTNKSTTGFTVDFSTPPPPGATLDWFLVR